MISQSISNLDDTSAAVLSSEKRFAPRRPCRLPALIHVDAADDGVACLIKDMSATGARIEILGNWTHPFNSIRGHVDRIIMIVRAERMLYDCRIVRRQDGDFGLKFVAPPQPIPKALR